ncbi:nucleotidyltransferase/DNA polymerase involved in DNA repair [Marssonina coronariae]|uniref:Nucleotidyltransferase/DNA polymerase involved in DNA repair n=1 Tax=Diplocarpon coronariae TaxID=2795749 RepID=A0A218Z789_9HELO|nr:nucleotidyltransferase/DNA polymerase involved in DNA repair [Marssonina coronariae]
MANGIGSEQLESRLYAPCLSDVWMPRLPQDQSRRSSPKIKPEDGNLKAQRSGQRKLSRTTGNRID